MALLQNILGQLIKIRKSESLYCLILNLLFSIELRVQDEQFSEEKRFILRDTEKEV